jgi:hypothetical protein
VIRKPLIEIVFCNIRELEIDDFSAVNFLRGGNEIKIDRRFRCSLENSGYKRM